MNASFQAWPRRAAVRGAFAALLAFCILICSCTATGETQASPMPEIVPEPTPALSEPVPSPSPGVPAASATLPPAAGSRRMLCIAADFVNLREKPGVDSIIVGALPAGAIADAIGQSGDWMELSYNGLACFAKQDYLLDVTAPAVPVPSGDWALVLVNPTHPTPEEYEITLGNFEDSTVDARILAVCEQMFKDAEEDGVSFTLVSAYRSRDYQRELYEKKVASYRAKGYSLARAEAEAATITARPGTSEHQTGLALDIVTPSYKAMNKGFARTDAFAWLDAHAHSYGFTLRYPSGKTELTKVIYEPWHWRFVGVDAAVAMKLSGECLEEYLNALE
ncbi:MAG: D-alanyl-D-alanine carboxypeptidase family protein [Bacillota bacterium]